MVQVGMIRALLWDHDGVLVDTEGLYFQATREVLAGAGVELTEALYHELFLVEGRGAFHLARERGADDRAIERMKFERHRRYSELLTSTNVLMPNVLAHLAPLAVRFRMAIVTSSRREHFEAIHRTSGLKSHFEFVLAREDYKKAKPDPEPYETALARLEIESSQALVIEDSERGLRAARAAGLRCWAIPSRLTARSSFEAAERRFDSLEELSAALLSL